MPSVERRSAWVGHPLLDSFQDLPERQASRRALGLDPDAPVLLLVPASRPQELRYLMPLWLVQRPCFSSVAPACKCWCLQG
jgi:lipid A disaccharide synthetase